MTNDPKDDAEADLQPQGASPGLDPCDPTAEAIAVASDHGSGAAAQSIRPMISDLFDLDHARDFLRRIGAQPRGMWKAVVTERQGRYARDVAIVRLKKDDSGWHLIVTAEDGDDAAAYQPTDGERQAIQFEAAQAR